MIAEIIGLSITAESILAGFISIILLIVAFLLKQLYQDFKQLKTEIGILSISNNSVDKQISSLEKRVEKVEKEVEKYNVDIPDFYKQFPKMVTEIVKPYFDSIMQRLEAIEKKN